MLYPKEIRNYRDWTTIDVDLWRQYWFGMVKSRRAGAALLVGRAMDDFGADTEADIDKHLAAFEDVAPGLAKAQSERGAAAQVRWALRKFARALECTRTDGEQGCPKKLLRRARRQKKKRRACGVF